MDKFLIPNKKRSASPTGQSSSRKNSNSYRIVLANERIFGNKDFRTIQEQVIETVLANIDDVFVVMPTGGGKSLLYQLPAVLSQGVTIVISPLLSLIEDQVSTLIQLPSGGIPAAYITSTCKDSMIKEIYADLYRAKRNLSPFLKLLYITPERVVKSGSTRDMFKMLYDNDMIARFVIDEAHCVSSWGHDFRRDYGQLRTLREEYPQVRITALTATARCKVSEDVIKSLRIEGCMRYSAGFDRPNIFFEVRKKPSKISDTYKLLLQYIMQFQKDKTGIIYCMTKKDTEHVSDFLREKNFKADYYHAGQTASDRKMVQSAWCRGDIDVSAYLINNKLKFNRSFI